MLLRWLRARWYKSIKKISDHLSNYTSKLYWSDKNHWLNPILNAYDQLPAANLPDTKVENYVMPKISKIILNETPVIKVEYLPHIMENGLGNEQNWQGWMLPDYYEDLESIEV